MTLIQASVRVDADVGVSWMRDAASLGVAGFNDCSSRIPAAVNGAERP